MSNIFVTGANRGIGLEYVRQYLERGERVFAGCREPAEAKDLMALKSAYPEKLSILKLDIRNDEERKEAFAKVGEEIDSLNLLINNAGYYPRNEAMGHLDSKTMLDGLHTNSVAPILVAQDLIGYLKKAELAKIVNISSGMGSISNAGGSSHTYRASKAALNMYSKVLAKELRATGIIVIVLHPGWVKTDMGGRGARLRVEESVKAQIKVIDQLKESDSGRFLQWDGAEIEW
jgi:NAD(P)-dependent dehydrogenase (short-subunit alcohol dehydrogenase family)